MYVEIPTGQIASGKHRKHTFKKTVVWVSKSSGMLNPQKSHSQVRQKSFSSLGLVS